MVKVTVESVNTNVTINVEKCCISFRANVILIIIQINIYCTTVHDEKLPLLVMKWRVIKNYL